MMIICKGRENKKDLKVRKQNVRGHNPYGLSSGGHYCIIPQINIKIPTCNIQTDKTSLKNVFQTSNHLCVSKLFFHFQSPSNLVTNSCWYSSRFHQWSKLLPSQVPYNYRNCEVKLQTHSTSSILPFSPLVLNAFLASFLMPILVHLDRTGLDFQST
jgi:hypothetical protein